MKPGFTLHHSVDLRIQMYMEPVSLKYGKFAAKYPRIYGYFYSVVCGKYGPLIKQFKFASRSFTSKTTRWDNVPICQINTYTRWHLV